MECLALRWFLDLPDASNTQYTSVAHGTLHTRVVKGYATQRMAHRDESEILHVINNFTRQRLTIAIPWCINSQHPVFEGNFKRALILLEDLNEAK